MVAIVTSSLYIVSKKADDNINMTCDEYTIFLSSDYLFFAGLDSMA